MKLFKCDNCNNVLYFENSSCTKCGHTLGFVPTELDLHTLVPVPNANQVYSVYNDKSKQYKFCKNHQYGVCNWLISANDPAAFCTSCEMNHVIPNLANNEHLRAWGLIEAAKHRLIYTLLQFKLPLVSKVKDPEKGISFDFLTDNNNVPRILTGHENGLITINVEEAFDYKREFNRNQLNEPYRTLLGHFRHESGHYFWDRIIDNTPYLGKFRQLFGDERVSYEQALQQYYNTGAPANWQSNFISAYASSHPWEDWAETWAHYLHLIDTLETASSFGIDISPKYPGAKGEFKASIRVNPYNYRNFRSLIDIWTPLTLAMNSLNRSMGNHDAYPFVLNEKAIQKMSFVHEVCMAYSTMKMAAAA
jgi:hypothetical protein